MKKIFLFFIIITFFSLDVYSDDKIFYFDMDKILNESNQGKQIIKELDAINKKNITQFKSKEDELKKIEQNISKVKNIISKEDLTIKINDLKKKISNYNFNKEKKIKEFEKKKNQELKTFLIQITPIIEKFMEATSINIILDKKNIFIANSKYDITNSIIEILNNKIKD